MRYAAIVCPKCQRAKGVTINAKKTKCTHCGKTLEVADLRRFHETDSETELARAVGQLNARVRGGLDAYTDDVANYEADIPMDQSSQRDRAIAAAQRLGTFTMEQFELACQKDGVKDPEKWLHVFMEESVVYEPRPGTYELL